MNGSLNGNDFSVLEPTYIASSRSHCLNNIATFYSNSPAMQVHQCMNTKRLSEKTLKDWTTVQRYKTHYTDIWGEIEVGYRHYFDNVLMYHTIVVIQCSLNSLRGIKQPGFVTKGPFISSSLPWGCNTIRYILDENMTSQRIYSLEFGVSKTTKYKIQ